MKTWLRAHPPVALGAENPSLIKAGLLPVEFNGQWRVYAMQPPATKPELGTPEFQIAKGTRMFRQGAKWQDCSKTLPEAYDELEPLPLTALREAEEEIGLPHTHIRQWFDMGEVQFLSATKGNKKSMQLYAAFLNAPLKDTEHACWLSLTEAKALMRKDHFAIVEHVVGLLKGSNII
jgi:hypothetical protein